MKKSDNILIDDLGLTEESLTKLKENKILLLNQLENFTEDDFINLKLSRTIVTDIIDKMAWYGYAFIEDKNSKHLKFELRTNEYLDEIIKRRQK